jgi:hypothetical protein
MGREEDLGVASSEPRALADTGGGPVFREWHGGPAHPVTGAGRAGHDDDL